MFLYGMFLRKNNVYLTLRQTCSLSSRQWKNSCKKHVPTGCIFFSHSLHMLSHTHCLGAICARVFITWNVSSFSSLPIALSDTTEWRFDITLLFGSITLWRRMMNSTCWLGSKQLNVGWKSSHHCLWCILMYCQHEFVTIYRTHFSHFSPDFKLFSSYMKTSLRCSSPSPTCDFITPVIRRYVTTSHCDDFNLEFKRNRTNFI